MKTFLLPGLLSLVLTAVASATPMSPIVINLGPSGPAKPDPVDFQFSDLNGTLLQGQPISFDLVFSCDDFPAAALQMHHGLDAFEIDVILFINQSLPRQILGSPDDTFAFGPRGKHFPAFSITPGVGTLGADNEPILVAGVSLDQLRNGDRFGGIHTSFVAPDAQGVEITGGEVFLLPRNRPFSVVDALPDTGSTLGLFAISLLACLVTIPLLLGYHKLKPAPPSASSLQ